MTKNKYCFAILPRTSQLHSHPFAHLIRAIMMDYGILQDTHLCGTIADDAHRDRALAGAARDFEPAVSLRPTLAKLVRRLHGSPAHVPEMQRCLIKFTWVTCAGYRWSKAVRSCLASRPIQEQADRVMVTNISYQQCTPVQLVASVHESPCMRRPAVHCSLQSPSCAPHDNTSAHTTHKGRHARTCPRPSPNPVTQRARTCTCLVPS